MKLCIHAAPTRHFSRGAIKVHRAYTVYVRCYTHQDRLEEKRKRVRPGVT